MAVLIYDEPPPEAPRARGKFQIYDEPVGVPAIEAAPPSPETAFAGLSPEQRGALAVEKLGPAEPASAFDVAGNAVRAATYAVSDIPAGIDQLIARYVVPKEQTMSGLVTGEAPTSSYETGQKKRLAEYEAQKNAALDKPGGTTGYVGGQIGTAFVPGTGAVKVLSTAGKVAKVAAAAKPIAAGVTLTALKPYETEADRAQAVGISAGLGATIPAVAAGVRGIGGVIRPRVPTGKPPPRPGAIPAADDVPPGGAAPAGVPPGGAPPGGPPGGATPLPPNGGFGDSFIRKLKAAPESRKKGELLETAAGLGVTPTPGQVAAGLPKFLEEQMMKLPGSRGVADKSSRASHESYHRALGREMGLEDMEVPYLTMDVIEAGKKKLSGVYDEILPHANVTQGTAVAGKLEFDAAKLTAPFSEVVSATVKKSAMKELQRIRDGITAGLKTGQIPGEDLKVLQTRMRQLEADPKLHTAVADRIDKFRTALNDTLATSLDQTAPELAARLRLNDRRWANASILEKVQSSAGANVDGFVSGPALHNTILARYKNPSKAGDFGKLAEMGRMFFQKAPDSGTADRILSNTILTGTGVGAFIDPATAASVYLAPKLAAHAYYQTPAYQRAVRAGRAVGSAGTRGGASGAGRTGRPEERPRNALVH
jgi:hypothetical protein